MYPDVFRVIDKKNENYGSCVNRALDDAKGKYFKLLDADDWFNTEALNSLLKLIVAGLDVDLIITKSEDRLDDGTLIQVLGAPDSITKGNVYLIEDFDGIGFGFNDLYCSHLFTYRTQILHDIRLRLQTGISYTDNEYTFFPVDKIKTIVCFDIPVYQYLVGRQGQTTDPVSVRKHIYQMVQVYNRMISYYNENKNRQITSVLNNQRIIIAELVRWIYRACFACNNSSDMRTIVDDVERSICDDVVIYNRELGWTTRYGFDLLAYYRNTGRFVDHPMTKVHLLYNRMSRWLSRKFTINNLFKQV